MNLDSNKIDFPRYFSDINKRLDILEKSVINLQDKLIQHELMNQTVTQLLIDKNLLTDDEIKEYFIKLFNKIYKKENKKQIKEEAEKNYQSWLLHEYDGFTNS